MPLLWDQPNQQMPYDPGQQNRGIMAGMNQYWPALLTAGLGMLEQSGWSTTPITAGQAIGRGGLLAMGPLMNIRQQIQTDNQNRSLAGAVVMKDNGEPDVAATARNLSAMNRPDLAVRFLQEQNSYQAQLSKQSIQNQEIQRRIAADQAQRALNDKIYAQQYANKAMFQMIQNNVPEEQAKQQAGLIYTGMLQGRGINPGQYDPLEQFGGGGGGENAGEAVPVSMDMPEDQGGLVQVGKKASPNSFFGPGGGEGPVPIEELQKQTPQTEGYNWLLAYKFNQQQLGNKFNPMTADFIIDYKTGKWIPNTPRTSMLLERAKAGKTDVTAAGGDIIMGARGQGELDKSILDTENALSRIRDIGASFRPEYLEVPTQLANKGLAFAEKFGYKLSPDQKQAVSDYTEFKRNSMENLNRYIKEITGAQMSAAEADRLRVSMPDPENDSPTQFKSKLDATLRTLEAARNRFLTMKAKGLSLDDAQKNMPLAVTPQQKTKPKPAVKTTPKPGGSIDFNELK